MRVFAMRIRGLSQAKRNSSVAPRHIIDINLLPADRRPPDIAPAAVVVVVLLLLCIGAMVPLAFRVHRARVAASAIEQQATDAERGVSALQLNLARQRGMSGELDAAKAKLARFQAEREAFQGGKRPLQDDLTMLFGYGAFLPPGVRVMAISGADHSLKVDGAALGPLDAIAYAERLTQSGGFSSAHLASFAPGAKEGGQFTLEVAR
jgi:hypothetical protein